MKLDQVRDDVTLIPDTGINEVVMIHEECESCYRAPGVVRWNPDPSTALEETKFAGLVDYFMTVKMFETPIQGDIK